MSARIQTPFDTLFEQLSTLMSSGGQPIRHDVGTADDAEHTSVDRVVWIMRDSGGIGVEPSPFALAEGALVGKQRWVWDVSLYSNSLIGLGALHGSLVGNIDLLQGPPDGCAPSNDGSYPGRPGYRVSDGAPGPRGGNAATSGFGMIMQVTLFRPLFSHMTPEAPILSVDRFVVVGEEDQVEERLAWYDGLVEAVLRTAVGIVRWMWP